MTRVVFPGSFDPMTTGHLDIIQRACKLFSKVIIGVGVNSNKGYMFSLDERVEMVKTVCKKMEQVEVHAFEGLTVEFAATHKAKAIVRSLRTEADYAYEKSMASMNHQLDPTIDTIMFEAKSDLFSISSSLVKDIASLGKDVSKFVPPSVFIKLTEKIGG